MLPYIIFAALWVFVLEQLFPGWKLPKVSTWMLRALTLNFIQVVVALVAGVTWNQWLSAYSLFHLSPALPAVVAGFIAYFCNTFVTYWWHRYRHANDFLWRTLHQIHHSPQRIEMFTSFYKHPLEMVVNSIIGSAVAYTILGIDVEAGAYYILFAAMGEIFYHSNLRTPHWLGFLFQRPEMHRVHHKAGHHWNNFSDFPIWDMLFGSYANPKAPEWVQGFEDGKEQRLVDMLLFRDVHPREETQQPLERPVEHSA
jgi:sterol desaturase/sphingolipid hydroxylase (fatty acid hydroxylase superfamily)